MCVARFEDRHEIVLDGQLPEDARILGQVSHAGRARRYIGERVTSLPSNKTVPPSASIRPIVIRKLVVLPAPLGPSRPTTSPRSTS